ncbi:unnamed protein product [Ambrosiozyma monospora]|uniref:Unnamed protein product n=1 Tax=Ambrosiozyma monospora TaxID=43982 RepID=A0ACB5U2M2_AMBMO|nr:unnamed protein product [Ambrosiozyma monospora]
MVDLQTSGSLSPTQTHTSAEVIERVKQEVAKQLGVEQSSDRENGVEEDEGNHLVESSTGSPNSRTVSEAPRVHATSLLVTLKYSRGFSTRDELHSSNARPTIGHDQGDPAIIKYEDHEYDFDYCDPSGDDIEADNVDYEDDHISDDENTQEVFTFNGAGPLSTEEKF